MANLMSSRHQLENNESLIERKSVEMNIQKLPNQRGFNRCASQAWVSQRSWGPRIVVKVPDPSETLMTTLRNLAQKNCVPDWYKISW